MGYTVCNQYGEPQPIRLVTTHMDGSIHVGQPFTPEWWSCDPCSPSNRRYSVDFGRNTQTYSWFEVIQTDDDERTIHVKTRFAKEVAEAYQRFQDARQAYERLVK